jgi:hypothetical protein
MYLIDIQLIHPLRIFSYQMISPPLQTIPFLQSAKHPKNSVIYQLLPNQIEPYPRPEFPQLHPYATYSSPPNYSKTPPWTPHFSITQSTQREYQATPPFEQDLQNHKTESLIKLLHHLQHQYHVLIEDISVEDDNEIIEMKYDL